MKNKILWPVVLILIFAVSRWPGMMPQNFSAAYALAFCAGLYLPGWLAWTFPLAIMAGSDWLLAFVYYRQPDYSFLQFVRGEAPIIVGYAALIGLGCALGKKRSWVTLLSGGIFGAMLFYLITNTASWMSIAQYPKTLAGWLQALTIGLPPYPPTWTFFRNTLLSGGIFSALFVGAMKMTEAPEPEPAAEAEAEPEEGPGALTPATSGTKDA